MRAPQDVLIVLLLITNLVAGEPAAQGQESPDPPYQVAASPDWQQPHSAWIMDTSGESPVARLTIPAVEGCEYTVEVTGGAVEAVNELIAVPFEGKPNQSRYRKEHFAGVLVTSTSPVDEQATAPRYPATFTITWPPREGAPPVFGGYTPRIRPPYEFFFFGGWPLTVEELPVKRHPTQTQGVRVHCDLPGLVGLVSIPKKTTQPLSSE